MHILLIHQAFSSHNEPGGTRHYELARRWVARGHRFTVIASNLSYLTGQLTLDSGPTEEGKDLHVRRAYALPVLHRSFIWRVVSFITFMLTSIWSALRAGPVDLVIGTSPPIFQAGSAWLVALLRRRPFLLEIRDLWPAFAIDLGVLQNPLLIRLSQWIESFLYRHARHLLVNSPAYRDYLIGKGASPAKISLIPNGVDPEMFDPAAGSESFRREWGLDGRFVLTYAGALGLANDIPTVLKAASQLQDEPQIHILLVGDGKERPNLEAMARTLHLANVTFTGSIPKRKMPEVMAASDACLAILKDIPMFRTTFPNKVFDYMAAGRPTILAIDGVIREVIEAAKGGIFVPPGDEFALAKAVSNLSRDRQGAREMGQAARDYVIKRFNRHEQAAHFVELIERLAKPGGKE